MCPHKNFTILYYDAWNAIMVRKCDDCRSVEIEVQTWTKLREIEKLMDQARREGWIR